MKKTLAFAFLALGTIAQAAQTVATCLPAPVTYAGSSGGGTEICSFAALPGGATINWVELTGGFDAVYDPFHEAYPDGVTVAYTFSGPGLLDLAGSVTPASGADVQSTGPLACVDAGGICADPTSPFDIVDSYTGSNAALTGATFNKRVTLDYTTEGEVPEPGTYALLGVGLLALGVRRKLA